MLQTWVACPCGGSIRPLDSVCRGVWACVHMRCAPGSLGCYLQLCRALLVDPPFAEPDCDSEVLARCHRHAVTGLHQQLLGERYQRWQASHHPVEFPACFDPHHANSMAVGISLCPSTWRVSDWALCRTPQPLACGYPKLCELAHVPHGHVHACTH